METIKTCVLRAGAIGDIIKLYPAIKSYQSENPAEEITLICGEDCRDVLRNAPGINIITFDTKKIYGNFLSALTETLKLINTLRRFDKCFVQHRDFRWRALPVTAGTKTIRMDPTGGYEFFPASCSSVTLPPKPYVVIACGGGRNVQRDTPQKRWTGYAELTDLILKHTDSNIAFAGVSADSPGIRNERIFDLCGKTSLSDAFHLIAGAEGFIGNDSALLHLALCTQTPAIGIFTATNPSEVILPGAVLTCIKSPLDCSPCEKHGRYNKNCSAECRGSISPEKVIKSLKSDMQG